MIVEVRVKGDRNPVIPSAERVREITDAGRHIPLVYTIAEVEDLNAANRITDILYGKHYVTSFRTDARYPVVTIAW